MPTNMADNRLLRTLHSDSRARLLPKLTSVSLIFREYLARTTEPIETVYFPTSGWVSTIVQMVEGRSAEVGLIGREGVVGLSNTNAVSTVDQMVQGSGQALAMNRTAFDREMQDDALLRRLMTRYQQSVYAMTTVSAACNGWHELEQRMARWLLSALDRTDGNDLPITQEFLAMMLCVHRPRVTVIARSLQMAGIITYSRGHIVINDREALETTACECYQTMRDQLEQVFH